MKYTLYVMNTTTQSKELISDTITVHNEASALDIKNHCAMLGFKLLAIYKSHLIIERRISNDKTSMV